MIVMKFGGTSIGDAEMLLNAAKIVKSYHSKKPVVVVSAMGGVTDLLIETAQKASQGDVATMDRNMHLLFKRHAGVANSVLKTSEPVLSAIKTKIDTLKTLYISISTLGELTKRSLDLVMSHGEDLSSFLFASVLNELGVKAEQVLTDSILITDDTFGSAVVDRELTAKHVQERLKALFSEGITPVITGFIGGTAEGIVTTLGRSGSDYTASIIGASINAEEIWIWTDVDGIMTADPRLIKNAKTIPEISYKEAAELSYFGANVIHPKTMLPAVEKNIPIRVKNTFNPDFSGTVIKKEASKSGKMVSGITSIKNLSLITVEGAGMMGVPGIAGKVFSVVAKNKANVLMISQASSEHSICFLLDKEDASRVVKSLKEAFANHILLKNIDTISVIDNVAIVAVVGENMGGTPGVAGRVFNELGENQVNIMAIAQGSSEINISFVVKEKDLEKAVRSVHEGFGLSR